MPTLKNNVRFSKKTMEHRPFHQDYCNTKSLVQHQYSASWTGSDGTCDQTGPSE